MLELGGKLQRRLTQTSQLLRKRLIRRVESRPQVSKSVQRAKKVVCVSPGLVDFAIGLVNSVLNLPERQVSFAGNSNYRRTVINATYQENVSG